MPTVLNIEFMGMCLLVDDPTKGLFHGLLLAPDRVPGHGGHERHHPRLFYGTAHDTKGATQPTGLYNSISLEDKALDLSRFTGTLDTTFGDVPDVTALTQQKVPRKLLSDLPLELVTSRITLAAGSGTPLGAEGPWKLPNASSMSITHKLLWTLSIDVDVLEWSLIGLNDRGGQPLTPLYPVPLVNPPETAPKPTINLRVMNVVYRELFPTDVPKTGAPKKGEAMAHFQPYYLALENAPKHPSPTWDGPSGPGGPIGGNFNCGLGRAAA